MRCFWARRGQEPFSKFQRAKVWTFRSSQVWKKRRCCFPLPQSCASLVPSMLGMIWQSWHVKTTQMRQVCLADLVSAWIANGRNKLIVFFWIMIRHIFWRWYCYLKYINCWEKHYGHVHWNLTSQSLNHPLLLEGISFAIFIISIVFWAFWIKMRSQNFRSFHSNNLSSK